MKNKKQFFLCWLALFVALMPTISHAYLDPATTTYLIQIVSALVISLSVTAGIFARRIYMFFVNIRVKLTAAVIKLFSKKKKSVRADLARTRPQAQPAHSAFIAKGQRLKFLFADDRPFYKRLLLALLLSAALSFTFIIFGIYDLFIANISEFPYSFNDIALPILLYGLAAIAILTVCLSIFKGKVFDLICSLALGVLVAGYLQGNFLNINLGELTGDAIAWHTMTVNAVINTAIWVIIIAAPLAIRYFSKKIWRFMVKAIPALLIAVQLISLVTLMFSPAITNQETRDKYLSTQGMLDVGRKENIVVFLLDRLDEDYIRTIAEEDSSFFDPLDGFIRYTNNTTRYLSTWPSVGYMLTGRVSYFEEKMSEHLTLAWKDGKKMYDDLHADGFTTNFYLEEGSDFNKLSDLEGIADNISEGKLSLKFGYTIRNFLRLSVFRYAPHIAKPSFWTSTDEFKKVAGQDIDFKPYFIDDFVFFDSLKNDKLKKSKDNKTFSFIHLNGPHPIHNMDEFGRKVDESQSSPIIQTKGCMRIVYEYISQLKTMGEYENSTIIITGDHGAAHYEPDGDVTDAMVTALLIKPSGNAGTPMEYNNAPVSSDNFRATILDEAGLDYSNYGPTYYEISENDKSARTFLASIYSRRHKRNTEFEIFEIYGDANDFANWHKVDEIEIKYVD